MTRLCRGQREDTTTTATTDQLTAQRRALIDRVEADLPNRVRDRRLAHILSVRDFALHVNQVQELGLDVDQLALAALCHDLAKHVSGEEQLRLAAEAGLVLDPVEAAEPWILHQKTSAWLAERDFGITDAALLHAVSHHTTAGPVMSTLDKLLYCADTVEPLRDFPGVVDMRQLVETDLEAGYAAVLAHTLRYVLDRGLPMHPQSVAAWNAIQLSRGAHD